MSQLSTKDKNTMPNWWESWHTKWKIQVICCHKLGNNSQQSLLPQLISTVRWYVFKEQTCITNWCLISVLMLSDNVHDTKSHAEESRGLRSPGDSTRLPGSTGVGAEAAPGSEAPGWATFCQAPRSSLKRRAWSMKLLALSDNSRILWFRLRLFFF